MALPPGTYHWRVRSIALAPGKEADNGPWGPAQVFTVQAPPAAPVLDAPLQQEGGVLLRWSVPDAGRAVGYRYRVQAGRDAGFAPPLWVAESSQPQAVLALQDAGRYHLRVQAVDADGTEGLFSDPQAIELRPAPAWKLLPAGFLLLLLLL